MTRTHPALADRARGVEQSAIRAMFNMAEAHEGDLVRLEVGEPDFDTPDHVVDAAERAARRGETHYTSASGIRPLRAAIADYAAEHFGYRPDPDAEVAVTVGAMEAVLSSLLTVANPGERVLYPGPFWPNYETQTRLAGATPVEVPMPADAGFGLDADRMVDAMDGDTAAVILNSPANPTGQVYTPEAMERVVAAAARHDAVVIADEVYKGLTYEGDDRSLAAHTEHPEHVLVVNSCSKEFAMTGWRLGWLTGPSELVEAATAIQSVTTACAPSVAQYAARAAMTGPREPIDRMRAAFADRRALVADRIADMPRVEAPTPAGAFYAFLDVSSVSGSSVEIAERLLTEYGVVTAPGEGFGEAGRGHIRVSFANSEARIAEGLDRIERMVRAEAPA